MAGWFRIHRGRAQNVRYARHGRVLVSARFNLDASDVAIPAHDPARMRIAEGDDIVLIGRPSLIPGGHIKGLSYALGDGTYAHAVNIWWHCVNTLLLAGAASAALFAGIGPIWAGPFLAVGALAFGLSAIESYIARLMLRRAVDSVSPKPS